jgi:hypothetical protein
MRRSRGRDSIPGRAWLPADAGPVATIVVMVAAVVGVSSRALRRRVRHCSFDVGLAKQSTGRRG